jgi:hypothetical protein
MKNIFLGETENILGGIDELYKIIMKNGTIAVVRTCSNNAVVLCNLVFGSDNTDAIIQIDKDSDEDKWFKVMGGKIRDI